MSTERASFSGDDFRCRVLGCGLAILMLMHFGCTPRTKTAEQVYAQRCAACHGKTGGGDGPVARSLPERPTAFSSAQWRATVNHTYVRKVIVRGGTHTGISPLMPSNEDLESRSDLLNDLVELVLGLSE